MLSAAMPALSHKAPIWRELWPKVSKIDPTLRQNETKSAFRCIPEQTFKKKCNLYETCTGMSGLHVPPPLQSSILAISRHFLMNFEVFCFFLSFFENCGPKASKVSPKISKVRPNGLQSEPKGLQGEPKDLQIETKWPPK